MLKNKLKKSIFTLIIATAPIIIPANSALAGDSASIRELRAVVIKMHMDERSAAGLNEDAAEHLAKLTQKIDAQDVDEKTVIAILSLMDSPNDGVRYWVARSLGNLGQRAKMAVPKLQKMLIDVDCVQGSKTSASGIRFALTKMGAPPPPVACLGIKLGGG